MCVLMTIFVTCPFPPTPNLKYSLTERDERRENRFTSQKSLSFRSFSRSLSRLSFRSLSFSSQKAFVVATVKEDLVTKSEREIWLKSNCFRSGILMQNSGSIRTCRGTNRAASNASFANVWSYWCSATNSSGNVFVVFFARKV